MNIKKIQIILLTLSLIFFYCKKETDEDRLKKIVKILAEAGSNKDIKTIKEYISKDYHDPKGNDYDGLKGLLAYYFLQHPRISIFITEQHVNLKGETATVEARAVLTSGREIKSVKDLLPEGMSYYIFLIDFKKIDGDWMIYSADWFRSDEKPENFKSIHELQMEEHREENN